VRCAYILRCKILVGERDGSWGNSTAGVWQVGRRDPSSGLMFGFDRCGLGERRVWPNRTGGCRERCRVRR